MPGEKSMGFFKLEDPFDLLQKLEHDLNRLKAIPTDSYAAFDFFVTATHMPEWIRMVGWTFSPPTEMRTATIFELCGKLGNGAKHFVLHKKFAAPTEVRDTGPFVPSGFLGTAIGGLDVVLTPATALSWAATASTLWTWPPRSTSSGRPTSTQD
jgi:hypothetical protein